MSCIFEIFIVFDIKLFSSFPTNVFQFGLLQFLWLFTSFINALQWFWWWFKTVLPKNSLQMWLYVFHAFSWWFWYFSKDIRQIFDITTLLESRIIPQCLMLMQIIYIHGTVWCINFLLFLARMHFHGFDDAFCVIHKIMYAIFFITKRYLVNMNQYLSCFLFDCIT